MVEDDDLPLVEGQVGRRADDGNALRSDIDGALRPGHQSLVSLDHRGVPPSGPKRLRATVRIQASGLTTRSNSRCLRVAVTNASWTASWASERFPQIAYICTTRRRYDASCRSSRSDLLGMLHLPELSLSRAGQRE